MSDYILQVKGLHTLYGESHILHGLSFDVKRGQTVSIMGEPGMLIVFPSHVFHGTEKKNTTDIPRVSISGDIIITAKPGVVTEHLLPHPTTWRAI